MAITKMNSGSTQYGGDSVPIAAMPSVDINKDVTANVISPVFYDPYIPTIATESLPILQNESFTDYTGRLRTESEKLGFITNEYKVDVAYNAMQILNTYNAVSSPDGTVTLYDLLNLVKGGYGALSSLISYNDGVYKKLIFDNEEFIQLAMGKIIANENYISQVESGLILKVDSVRAYVDSTYTDVNGSIHNLNQLLITEKGLILSSLREEVDALGRFVSINFASLEIFNDRIATLVSQQAFDELGNLVSRHESSIVQLSNSITLTVTQEEFNSLSNRTILAESQLQLLSTEISARVTLQAFNDLGVIVTEQESKLSVMSDEILARVTKASFDDLGLRVGVTESTITQHSNEISLRVTNDTFNALGDRVATAESTIIQNTTDISLRVTTNTFNQLNDIVGNHTTLIQQNADNILLSATKSSVDVLTGRVSTAEGRIDISNNKISLLISDDNIVKAGVIVDAINGGSVTIAANKINIDGTTTFANGYNPYAKSRTFTNQPTVPYRIGDIWIKDNEIYTSSVDKLTGVFNIDDWYKAVKYTDDSVALSKNKRYITTYFIDPVTAVNYDPLVDTPLSEKQYHVGDEWLASDWVIGVDGLVENIGIRRKVYTYVNSVYLWVFDTTVIDGGQITTGIINADLIDAKALFSRQLTADNLTVIKGKVGNFTIDKALTGTDGTNDILLDPDVCRIYLRDGVGRSVDIKSGALTGRALLVGNNFSWVNTSYSGSYLSLGNFTTTILRNNSANIDGSTAYNMYISSEAFGASAVSTNYLAKPTSKFITLASVGRSTVYTLDVPINLGFVHSMVKHDGKYDKRRGTLAWVIKVAVYNNLDVLSSNVSTHKASAFIDNNSTDTLAYGMVHKLQVTVPSGGGSYYIKVTVQLAGDIQYQEWKNPTIGSSYWQTDAGLNNTMNFAINTTNTFNIKASIGRTELTTNGFQTVWSDSTYFRINGDNPSAFIETAGTWMHNGRNIVTVPSGQTAEIDLTNYATQNYVQTNFLSLAGGTLSGGLTINGTITINGDITQNGTSYITHAEHIYTEDDLVFLRSGATAALGAGIYTGLQAIKYDGTNDGQLVFDNTGTARVGDVGSLVPIAARDEAANMTTNSIVYWDGTTVKLKTRSSAFDSDKLGTYVAADYPRKAEAATITGPWIFNTAASVTFNNASGIILTGNVTQNGSNTVWDFSPVQEMRIGRNSNNASFKFSILYGDGTFNANHVFNGKGDTFLNLGYGNLIIGGNVTPKTKLHVRHSNSGIDPTNVNGVFIENSGSDASYYALQITTAAGNIFGVANNGNVGIGSLPSSADKLLVNGRATIKVATTVQNELMQYSGTERALIFYRDSDHNWGINIADTDTPASYTRFRIVGSIGDIRLGETGHGNILIGGSAYSNAKLMAWGSIKAAGENTYIAADNDTNPRQGMVKKSGYQPRFITGNTTPFIWSISDTANIQDVAGMTPTDIMNLSVAGILSVDQVRPRRLGVTQNTGEGDGISLYSSYVTTTIDSRTIPTYGMFFGRTNYFGTHGYVNNTIDWATYFTMSSTANRGWIFMAGNTPVASIDTLGRITANKELTVTGVTSDAIASIHASDTYTAIQRFVINNVTKWDIQVSATNANLDFQASGSDSVLQLTTDGSLVTPSFVSGFTGNGFKLAKNDNGYTSLTIDNLTVRRTMSVYELIVNQLRGNNGSEIISDTMKVKTATARTDVDAYTYNLYFDLDNGNKYITFVAGDIIRAQRFDGRNVILVEGRVDFVGSDYVRIRTFGYSNTPNSDLAKLDGLTFCRFGNTTDVNRQGFIYLTSSDDGSPYIDVVDGVVDGRFTTPKNIRYVRDTLRGSTVNTGNHWVEIQVFNDAGTNVASGKIPTSINAQNATYPYSRVTDGDTTSTNYATSTVSAGTEYMLIDLGSIQSIATIKVWHFYSDARKYNTRLEVSEDGITWHCVYDSDVSGTYTETATGKTHTLGASKTKVRLGKLTGINDVEMGALTGYGLYADNVFLKGTIVANSGRIAKWTINDTAIYTGGLYLTDYANQYDADNRLVIGANYSATSLGGHIKVRKDATNYVEMKMNTSNGTWGINGVVASASWFQLGSTNQIAGWNFNADAIYKDFRGNGSTVWMGVDNVLGAANTSVRGFGITIDSSNRMWLGQTATSVFEFSYVVGGLYKMQLTNTTSQIAGWTFTDTKFTKVLSTVTATIGAETHATGWTGFEVGVDSNNRLNMHTNGTNYELYGRVGGAVYFSLGNAAAYIGGWNFNSTRLWNGSSSTAGATSQNIYINTANSGTSGTFYNNSVWLKGFVMTWHQSSNAGHIVMGQIADTASTLKTGYLGIQMMDHTGVEYFCLSAETTVSGTRAVYNRIAGWAFDNVSFYEASTSRIRLHKTNGLVVSNAATSNSVFANSNRVNVYYTSDTDWGIIGVVGGNNVFRLGSTNQIAGCTFNTNAIFASNSAWSLGSDGSGKLAGGKILWTAAGVLTIDGGVLTKQIQSINWNGTDTGSLLDINDGSFYIGGDRIIFNATDTLGKLIRIKNDDGNTGVFLGNFALTSPSTLGGNEIITAASTNLREFVTTTGANYAGTKEASFNNVTIGYVSAINGGAFTLASTASNITLSASTTYVITFSVRLNLTANTDYTYLQSPYDVYENGSGATGLVFADLTDGSDVIIATSTKSVDANSPASTYVTFKFNAKTTSTGIIRIKLRFSGTGWNVTSVLDATKTHYETYVYGFDLNLQCKSAFTAQAVAGISEISSKGFQVIKDATTYFRIDQTVTNAYDNYIESYGKWEHKSAFMSSVFTKATSLSITGATTLPMTNTRFVFYGTTSANITLPTKAQIEAVYGTGNSDGYTITMSVRYDSTATYTINTGHYDNNGSYASTRALSKGDTLVMFMINSVWQILHLVL